MHFNAAFFFAALALALVLEGLPWVLAPNGKACAFCSISRPKPCGQAVRR